MVVQALGEIIPDTRKIAVLRANGIGDFIFAVPALEALRAAYPTAEIVLIANAWHASFLADRPGPIDRVVVVPTIARASEPADGIADVPALDGFFDAMVRERFDLAIQMHGGGRYSNPFLLRLGALHTAGMRTPDAARLERTTPYVYFQHEVLRHLEAVALVGADPSALEPRIPVTGRDLDESYRALPGGDRPLAVLHPGAGDTGRRWPPEKFAAVGDALAAGAEVAVIGTAPERAVAAAVVAGMHAGADNLCERLTLGGLAGLLSRAAVVVSNDSGPLHLAAAVGAPTVGIYWAFNVVTAGPLFTARHRPVISWRLTCPICGADRSAGRCPHQPSFVAEVPVEKVIAAARDLLGPADSGPTRSGDAAS